MKNIWLWVCANKTRQIGALAAVVAAMSLLGFAFFQGMEDKPSPALLLQRGYFESVIEADGMIESAHKAEVYAPSGLRIEKVFVEEGDIVWEGDLLAQLDIEALSLEIQRAELNIRSAEANMSSEQSAQANSVASARNALSSAEISLETAKREYHRLLDQQGRETSVAVAEINLDSAQRAYAYNLSLYEIGGISREMLTQAENMLDKAQTAYEDAIRGAREALDRAQDAMDAALIRHKSASDALSDAIEKNTDPAAAALELQRVAHQEKLLRLRDASITAPSRGVVTLVNASEGAPASGLMFVIEDSQALIVRARVAETDIASVSTGTPCRILSPGGAYAYDGLVTLIPSAAERDASGAFSAVIGDDAFFMVEAAVEEGHTGLRIGMNVKVSLIAGAKEDCYAIPNGLIFRDGARCWVITVGKDGKWKEVPVETGLETRRMTEIYGADLFEGMAIFHQRG
ncbi:MAG: HlyD family secretion protein [Clostridiales bacterium]|nr:HlyD family secretion protein [Clostridiales bacterium]